MLAILMYLVVGIADGDTITVRCGDPGAYRQERIRISAIDAPESRQPFGQRSKQELSALCFQQLARITDKGRDRYQRMVADVECQGRDVGQHQVQTGMAWVYDRYATGYQGLYPLQKAAQDARRGLWSDADPTPPWEWRRSRRPGKTTSP